MNVRHPKGGLHSFSTKNNGVFLASLSGVFIVNFGQVNAGNG